MAEASVFDLYRVARRSAFMKLDELRARVDLWLDRHESGPPESLDLTELEMIQAEREVCLAELQVAEERLVEALIIRWRSRTRESPDLEENSHQ